LGGGVGFQMLKGIKRTCRNILENVLLEVTFFLAIALLMKVKTFFAGHVAAKNSTVVCYAVRFLNDYSQGGIVEKT
jgi:hypothetical protein